MKNGNVGIIYILTNESMPGIIKIGCTTDINQRLKSLDNTSIPTPFTLYYAIEIDDYEKREHNIHYGYSKDRIRNNREFFTLEPENAVAMLRAIGGREISDMTDITIDETGNHISVDTFNKKLAPAPITTFKMLGLTAGDTLTFSRDESIICKIKDDRKVEYNNEEYSLSDLTRKILKEKYNWKSNHVNGFHFWKYEDGNYGNEILFDRRRRIEAEYDSLISE